MTEIKKLKVQFAPGCFDHFDGTQEELDEMIKEVTDFFNSHTAEEIKAMSTPLDQIDLDDLTDEEREKLLDMVESIENEPTRKDLH